jgi:uncharacterized Zn finger protein
MKCPNCGEEDSYRPVEYQPEWSDYPLYIEYRCGYCGYAHPDDREPIDDLDDADPEEYNRYLSLD